MVFGDSVFRNNMTTSPRSLRSSKVVADASSGRLNGLGPLAASGCSATSLEWTSVVNTKASRSGLAFRGDDSTQKNRYGCVLKLEGTRRPSRGSEAQTDVTQLI